MPHLKPRRIGQWLLILVTLSALPGFLVLTWHGTEERGDLRQEALARNLGTVHAVAAQEERIIEGARIILDLLAQIPEVRDATGGAACPALVSEILPEGSPYANVGVADLRGNLTCASVPILAPVNVADRAYFRRALQTGDFAVGDYIVGRVTGMASLGVARPIAGVDGAVAGIVILTLDLGWMEFVASRVAGPEIAERDASLVILDSDHTVLAGLPAGDVNVGEPLRRASPFILAEGESDGAVAARGTDGVLRLWAYTRLSGSSAEAPVIVALGTPAEKVVAEANGRFQSEIATLAGTALVTVGLGGVTARTQILRPVRSAVDAAEAIRAGDLRARAIEGSGAQELAELVSTLNTMAEALSVRDRDLRAAEERVRGILDAAPDAMVVLDARSRVLLVNRRVTEWFGYASSDLVGRPPTELLPERFRGGFGVPSFRVEAGPEAAPHLRPVLKLDCLRKGGGRVPVELAQSSVQTVEGVFTIYSMRPAHEAQGATRAA